MPSLESRIAIKGHCEHLAKVSSARQAKIHFKTEHLAKKGEDQKNLGRKIAKESWLTMAVVFKTGKKYVKSWEIFATRHCWKTNPSHKYMS